jgi:hypothetical protein
VLITNRLDMSVAEAVQLMAHLDFAHERLEPLDHDGRARIVEAVTGQALGAGPKDTGRVSNGIFAACLAFALGASEVVLGGISLTSGRHDYTDEDRPRRHVPADQAAIAAMRDRKLCLRTSEPDLAAVTGLDTV